MKIKELIKGLKEVEKIKPDSTVCIWDKRTPYDFTGFGVDDICDVELYVARTDKEA